MCISEETTHITDPFLRNVYATAEAMGDREKGGKIPTCREVECEIVKRLLNQLGMISQMSLGTQNPRIVDALARLAKVVKHNRYCLNSTRLIAQVSVFLIF